ncbi:hypothetical protein ZHAS_00019076 [Anopheles sinensis]|uniref:Uncharacterized protein n=1 Tax=Anopheles sinensis TaxID=74873 RepID=A0A084WLD3_ANOSI|nr:hypothetical protein ZHAS_00019076 [Anopheles sinensis]
MSPVRKKGISSMVGIVAENDGDDTVNEDDHANRLLEDLSAADGEEDHAQKTDIERRNERNSGNLCKRSCSPGKRLGGVGGGGGTTSDSKSLDHKFNRLLTEVNGLRDQIGDRIETLNRRLTQTNRLFLTHQDYGNRSSKAGDLLLVGIPAHEGENLRECFVRIARRLGYTESEIPMVHIKRLATGFGAPASPGPSGTPGHPTRPRPTHYNPAVLDNLLRPGRKPPAGGRKPANAPLAPAVQVQFVFRNARNEFYRRYLERGKTGTCLELGELGYEGPGRVYVNENLTRCNLTLKAEAMRLKRDGKLKSVFTVNGQIYVKRTIDHRPELVTSSVDLLLLDGSKMKANK